MAGRVRSVVMGAGGRDFHTVNTLYRNDPSHEVVAFTAAQIPGIAGRRYPPGLAGPLYPDGIAIHDESELAALICDTAVERVVFASSDGAHVEVMQRASRVLAAGAEFVLPDPRRSMLPAPLPVIAVCAVRTGGGKSRVALWIGRRLAARAPCVSASSATRAPWRPRSTGGAAVRSRRGSRRRAVHDRGARGKRAAPCRRSRRPGGCADGGRAGSCDAGQRPPAVGRGNNDFSFIPPDLFVVLADALRPGHERLFHPGEAVLRRADIMLIAKANAAAADVAALAASLCGLCPGARILRSASVVTRDDPARCAVGARW